MLLDSYEKMVLFGLFRCRNKFVWVKSGRDQNIHIYQKRSWATERNKEMQSGQYNLY